MYILASLFLKTGTTLSKYITTTNGSDAARLIAFGNLELTETGEFSERNHMLVQHGVNLNKRAVIQFEGAETAVYIFMRVDTSALDLDVDSMRHSCLSEHFVPVAASVGIAHRLYHYYTSQHRIRLSAERSWSGCPPNPFRQYQDQNLCISRRLHRSFQNGCTLTNC